MNDTLTPTIDAEAFAAIAADLAEAEPGSPAVVDFSQWDDAADLAGIVIRCRVESDDVPTDVAINSADCWGRVEYVNDNRHGYPRTRPEGFDGAAEKFSLRDGSVWWQPPTDVPLGSEQFDQLRRIVADLIEYGFSGVVVELCRGTDAYSRPVVVAFDSLWGIDSLENGYLATVAADLLAEVLGEAAITFTRQADQ